MIWLKRLFKFLLIVGLILAILLFVLSLMGGNNDTLKKALEDFLSETTNTEVTIGQLNHVGFYPNLVFDFEDLKGRSGEGGELDVFTVGSVRLAMGFWDMTFSQGKIKDVTIRDIYLAPGLWGQQIVSLESFGIVPSGETQESAAIIGTGLVGDKAFNMRIDMIALEDDTRSTYKFSQDKEIDFTLGDSAARLVFENGSTDLEPLERGDDYCDLVRLLSDLDVEFPYNCNLPTPVKTTEEDS